MKRRKLPYIHILPRVLIGVLVLGALVALIYVPLLAKGVFSFTEVADAATATLVRK